MSAPRFVVMGLSSIVNSARRIREKGWVRNRVALASNIAAATGLGMGLYGGGQLAQNTPASIEEGVIELAIGISAAFIGGYASLYSKCGTTTQENYVRTLEHINRHGCLDSRYAVQVIEGGENGMFEGYCEQQGLYLAARDTENLNIFRQVCRARSNIILPFF